MLLRRSPSLGSRMGVGGPGKLLLARYPYSIHYRVTRSGIRVARVFHQAQMFRLLTFGARQPVRRGLHDFLVPRSRSHRLA